MKQPTYKEMQEYCGISSVTFAKYKNGKVLASTSQKIARGFVAYGKDLISHGKVLVTTYEEVDINKPLPTIDECEAKYLAVQDAFRHVENVRRKEAQHIKGTHTDAEIMTLAENSPAVNEAKLNFITVLNEEI